MRVPKILYHGTTMARWHFIKKNGLMRPDMRKSFDTEECFGKSREYVYFTADLNQAIKFGLVKLISDMESLDYDKVKEYPNYRDVAVIGINTSELGNQFDIDPEANAIFTIGIRNGKIENVQLYRYKGNIKLQYLFLYKYYPFDIFSNKIINKIIKDVHNYRIVCKTIIQERRKMDSSTSFLEVLAVMDKVRSIHENRQYLN